MKKFIGIASILLMAASSVIAYLVLRQQAVWLGMFYLCIAGILSIWIVYTFCTKCPFKKNCAHVLPGLLTRFFRDKQPGPYTKFDRITG